MEENAIDFKKLDNEIRYTDNGELVIPYHDVLKGEKDFVLASLEIIIGHLNRPLVKDRMVKYECSDLINLLDKGEEYYHTVVKEVLELKKLDKKSIIRRANQIRKNYHKRKISQSEKLIVRTIATSLLSEYALKTEFNRMDYGAMKVLAEFCHQVVNQGIKGKNNIDYAKVYVGNNDKLEAWAIYYDKNKKSKLQNDIVIMWEATDELYHNFKINNNELLGLSEESVRQIASAKSIANNYVYDDNGIFSYNSIAIIYLGVIEQELRNLIGLHNKEYSKNKMMWSHICEYLKNNKIEVLNQHNNLYNKMKSLHQIRNKVAHGTAISKKEYEMVNDFAIKEGFIKSISIAKVLYKNSTAKYSKESDKKLMVKLFMQK